MVEAHNQSFVGVSRRRASLFALSAGVLFVLGFSFSASMIHLDVERDALDILVVLLTLLLMVSAVQGYTNGSAVLALLLAVALPLGFWADSFLLQQEAFGPRSFWMLRLGSTLGLLFGGTGYLIGAQATTVRDTTSNPSYRGQLAIGALLLGFVAWFFS